MPYPDRRLTQTLIRFPAARVNSLATVNEGQRLERFVRLRWGRKQGGIRKLAVLCETSADTIYRWFNGQTPPDVYYLGKLALALGVKRWEIVAAMDGEAVQADPLAARVERLEAMVDGLVQGVPSGRGTRGGAAPPVPQAKAG
jgi:transcriptional regulator with XRE-family HTH domain